MVLCFLRTHGLFPNRSGAALLLAACLGKLMTPSAEAAGPGHCPPICNQPPPPPHPPCFPNCPAIDDLALVGVLGGAPPDLLDPNTIPIAVYWDWSWHVAYPVVGAFAGWSKASGAVALKGDFNADGHADIALTGVAGWNTLPVAFSKGDGTFRVTNLSITDFAGWAATMGAVKLVGDFNHDGRTDIALTGPAGWGSIPVAFSNGDGSFNVTNVSVANFPGWAATSGAAKLTGDFNGDGLTDIALTGPAGWGSVPVAFSNGNGSFSVTNLAISDFAGWAATAGATKLVGDFNGDGLTDLALTGGAGWQTIPIAFSNGDGSFVVTNLEPPCSEIVGSGKPSILGDFNGDQRADIFVAHCDGTTNVEDCAQSHGCVLLSDGNGGFADAYGVGTTGALEVTGHLRFLNRWVVSPGGPGGTVHAGHFTSDGRTGIAVVGGGYWANGVWVSFSDIILALFNADGTLESRGTGVDDYDFCTSSDSSTAVKVLGRFR